MAKISILDQMVRLLGMQFKETLQYRVRKELRIHVEPIIEKIAVEICKDIKHDLDSGHSMSRMRDEIIIRLQLNDREIDLETLLSEPPPDGEDDN